MANTTTMTMMRSTGVLVGMGLGLSIGCLTVRPNPNHCANLEGDRTCGERYPGDRVYCTACGAAPEDGCVAERPEDACYSPCGGGGEYDDVSCLPDTDTSSSSGEESTSTAGSTATESSGESSTTGPMPCVGNEDCPDAAAPFCEPASGECVTCDALGAEADAACAELDPMAPLCVEGTCVACTPENPVVCDDQLLLCDGTTNSCVQCTAHEQCGSGACELAMGRCFPEDFVAHVDGDGGQDYTSVALAVAAVDDGTHGVIVVHELDGGSSYQVPGGVTIDGGKIIALLTAPGESPNIQGTGAGNPGLRVEGSGTALYVDGLTASLSPGVGLLVDGAFAWVDRSRIVQNTGGGVLAQNAAELTLRNCFVGGPAVDVDAVAVNASSIDVLYTTLGGGTVLGGRARALFCEGASSADVRNSILISADPMPELECPGGTLANSATESDVGMLNIAWFNGYATGDFHLTPSGATTFADIGQWQTGDPSTDIDGDLRPTVDGTTDVAGADVP